MSSITNLPDLVDNGAVRGTNLATVLTSALENASEPRLWVATAYFNLDGFDTLGEPLERVQELRLLIGTEQDQEFVLTYRLAQELERHFALIRPESQQKLERWAAFVRQDKVQVRRYKPQKHGEILHGKAYLVFGVPMLGQLGIIGSSNFTGAGLTTNLELNALLKQQSATGQLYQWYEQLWEQAEDYKAELLAMLEQFTRPLKPYEVYIKVVYEAYRDRLVSELGGQDDKPSPIILADFQRDGYHAAREILEQYGGVLIADSVGLGKTYLALRLLDDYAYQQRKTALVICPASLRDTVWRPLLEYHAIPHRIESMEQISRGDLDLGDLAQYSVIVVDESHNFRNPGTNRWQNLFKLLRNASPEQVRLILLTATPVNNSVYDLYHQIRLITRDQRDFFQIAGIDNLEGYFRKADEERESLYELLEAISVRRSRAFIRRHYPDAVIDGKRIQFPERHIHPVQYDLQKVYGGDLYRRVAQTIEELRLAPYQIDSYRNEVVQSRSHLFGEDWEQIQQALRRAGMSEEQIRKFRFELGGQAALANLMRVLYLKRLESSVEALRNSLRHQLQFQWRFLHALQQGRLLTSKDYRRMVMLEGDDEEDPNGDMQAFWESLQPVDASKYNLHMVKCDVQADIDALESLLAELDKLQPQNDAKLNTLIQLLSGKLWGEKVLIFSYYKDTARMLYRELKRRLPSVEIALVDSDVKMEDRRRIVQRFSPRSNRYTLQPGEREIQILIATDALSEGQNLQDARIVVNYDLHWNPVRMVQRIGRIDRIGSPHNTIEVYNFIPEDALESLLGLMQRLLDKLGQINRTVGLDESVLGEAPNPMDFNTLKRIAAGEDAVLEELEQEGELSIGEFLMEDLMNYLKELGEEHLGRIPLGRGTAKYASSIEQRGFFAAFRHTRTERHYWLFQRADGSLETAQLHAIRAIRSTPDDPPAPLPDPKCTEELLHTLRTELLKRLNQQVHRAEELPTVQRQILRWLRTLPSSALRNELLQYFGDALPATDLKELGTLWREVQKLAPQQAMHQQAMQRLNAFAESHPHPPVNPAPLEETAEEDLECIAWMWVLPREDAPVQDRSASTASGVGGT
ncbi:RNA polymerase-associated protein RapA [bacterium HR15]|nr:RNA polymerase-associated protein RapA [bacterium HR15]